MCSVAWVMMWLPFSLVHLGDALDGKVVALGRAGGEDDFLRGRADQLGDALARLLHRLLGHPAELVVAAGGVAEVLGEVGQHLLHHARIGARGGVVVHVDGQLHVLVIAVTRNHIRAHCFRHLLKLLGLVRRPAQGHQFGRGVVLRFGHFPNRQPVQNFFNAAAHLAQRLADGAAVALVAIVCRRCCTR